MTKEEIKTLVEDAENQLLLAKDSINNGDWDKAGVRLQKVMDKALLLKGSTAIELGRKRSVASEAALQQEKNK